MLSGSTKNKTRAILIQILLFSRAVRFSDFEFGSVFGSVWRNNRVFGSVFGFLEEGVGGASQNILKVKLQLQYMF